jgi:hypothetical protein
VLPGAAIGQTGRAIADDLRQHVELAGAAIGQTERPSRMMLSISSLNTLPRRNRMAIHSSYVLGATAAHAQGS